MNSSPSSPSLASKSNVTLKQIARELGVSHQLVSFALNDTGRVGDETRARIKETAARMGYQRNGSAMAMKKGRFGSVALLLSHSPTASSLPAGVLHGLMDELQGHDQHLSLFRLSDEELTDESLMPKVLREWMADGMIVDYTHQIPPGLVEIIENHRLPAIWLNANRDTDCVRPDDFGAGQMAARHLLDLGHRHIAYVGYLSGAPHADDHHSLWARREGVRKAVEVAGARFTELPGNNEIGATHAERVAARREWLRLSDRASALVCYATPRVILRAAELENLAIPHDLSLITFGSKPNRATGEDVALDTIVLNDAAVGRQAARLIRRKIERPDQTLPLCQVPCQLVAAGSCGPLAR